MNNESRSIDGLTRELTRFTYFRGRVALSAILRALGIGSGDEVLLQAFTCVAVPEGIMSVGAKPRYVDIALGSPNMDPRDFRRQITPRTRAVIVQHSYGLPADIPRIMPIAREHGIAVIEDCAHTIMSRISGELVGSFGDAAFYSYEAAKPVFVGAGGSAVVNNPKLRETLAQNYEQYEEAPRSAQLENQALVYGYQVAYRPSTYWTVRSAFRALSKTGLIRGNYNKLDVNYRPAWEFSRRLGRMQAQRLESELKKLAKQTDHRLRVVERYRREIQGKAVEHFSIPTDFAPVFGRYPLVARNKTDLIASARDARVELAGFYDTAVQPLSGEGLRVVGYEPGSCPEAEHLADHVVSLPTGTFVTDRVIERTVKFLNEVVA